MKDFREELDKEEINKYYENAIGFVAKASKLVLDFYNSQDFTVELKSDVSPVTEADLASEKLLRNSILETYPEHGIIGEEYDPSNPSSDYQWTIDPIDGTQNFAAGIPTFGIMLSLRFKNKPIVGIIDHPALKQNYSAAYSFGTKLNGKAIKIKDCNATKIEPNHIIATSTTGMFKRTNEQDLMLNFIKSHDSNRMYMDCWGHSLTACGSIDAMAEFNVRIWDASPTELLITEAGGAFRYVRNLPSTKPEEYTDFLSAIFGKPSVVALLEKHFNS